MVTTPKGFKEAYAAFREGGWTGLACDPDYGGQGLPHTVQFVMQEFICSANLGFELYPEPQPRRLQRAAPLRHRRS